MKNPEIHPSRCAAHLALTDGAAVLAEAARHAAAQLGLAENTIRDALKNRESLGSTGLAHGVALPHCALPDATEFSIGIITLEKAISFGALDGKRSDIFVFVVGPEPRRTEHVRILAALTGRLREESVRDALRAAPTGEALAGLFEHGLLPEQASQAGSFSLMIISVQNDDLYEPILETVSGEPDASVSVSSTQSAGSILHRMPLFATFWGDQETREIRRIDVVLPRDRVNRTIRRLEDLADGGAGVQIGVVDLSYCSGVLDL